jgi:hypothetical protein
LNEVNDIKEKQNITWNEAVIEWKKQQP